MAEDDLGETRPRRKQTDYDNETDNSVNQQQRFTKQLVETNIICTLYTVHKFVNKHMFYYMLWFAIIIGLVAPERRRADGPPRRRRSCERRASKLAGTADSRGALSQRQQPCQHLGRDMVF